MGDPWFYIVLLGVAALVYALLLPGRKSAAGPKTEMAGELEATLEQYMSEIEKENEELIALVAQMKQDFTSKQLAQQEQMSELRQRLGKVELAGRENESRLGTLEASVQEKASLSAAAAAVEPPAQPPDAAAPALPHEPEEAVQAAEETPPEEEEPAQELVRDRYPELFDLYAKGKSIDMIAKSVGLQRGEVQLILQLAKKEESR